MILPNKYIPENESLFGLGALLLLYLLKPSTISSLWEKVRAIPEIGTFERFILTLDFLFIIGAIDIDEGLLRRCSI